MDKAKIIDKYKKLKNPELRGKLADNSEIIGMEVDENNFLHYVIKKDNNFSVEEAQYTKLAVVFPKLTMGTVINKV